MYVFHIQERVSNKPQHYPFLDLIIMYRRLPMLFCILANKSLGSDLNWKNIL